MLNDKTISIIIIYLIISIDRNYRKPISYEKNVTLLNTFLNIFVIYIFAIALFDIYSNKVKL